MRIVTKVMPISLGAMPISSRDNLIMCHVALEACVCIRRVATALCILRCPTKPGCIGCVTYLQGDAYFTRGDAYFVPQSDRVSGWVRSVYIFGMCFQAVERSLSSNGPSFCRVHGPYSLFPVTYDTEHVIMNSVQRAEE